MNELKEKYYIALGNLQNMAIDNTKGSKGVDICVLDINEYVAYLQSKIDKAIEEIEYFELQAKHLNDNIYLDESLTNKLLDILK